MSYAQINGTKYSQGSILICTVIDDEPVFGKIIDIIITENNTCLFVLNAYKVNTYNQHYNAYEVDLLDETVICENKDFADYHLLCINKSFNRTISSKNFICLKYHTKLYFSSYIVHN